VQAALRRMSSRAVHDWRACNLYLEPASEQFSQRGTTASSCRTECRYGHDPEIARNESPQPLSVVLEAGVNTLRVFAHRYLTRQLPAPPLRSGSGAGMAGIVRSKRLDVCRNIRTRVASRIDGLAHHLSQALQTTRGAETGSASTSRDGAVQFRASGR
jgi:hypothetical protein